MFDINEMKKNVTDKFNKVADTNFEADSKTTEQEPKKRTPTTTATSTQLASIGPSIHFKGELTGEEGLIIDGKVEGTIDLKGNQLIIGTNGDIKADVYAQTIIVNGSLTGELHGKEKVHISKTGKVNGNIIAPRVSLEDGAKFKGSIDMSETKHEKPSKNQNNLQDNQLKRA
jgi:cytoskeletal protein CcmA (bactofilin family)